MNVALALRFCVLAPCLAWTASSASSQVCTTRLLSADAAGQQSVGASFAPALTPDGRYVLFVGAGSDLVPGDSNGVADLFVRDRVNGTIERVSVDAAGSESNGASGIGTLSPDGRFIVFESRATNLVAGDTNGIADFFLKDRSTGSVVRVSLTSSGAEAHGDSSVSLGGGVCVSADGRYVAFMSGASDLVGGDTNNQPDIFLRDTQSGTTTRVSVNASGAQTPGSSGWPAMSHDARFIAFQSGDGNLIPGDGNNSRDIFVKDMVTGAVQAVSVASGGVQLANQPSASASLSADGRLVTYTSFASNLVPFDVNSAPDVFVHDRWTSTTSLVSVGMGGAPANGTSFVSRISANGRFVAFDGLAPNLVPGDMAGSDDLFVRDLVANTTVRATLSVIGVQQQAGFPTGAVSDDGTVVAFQSEATNLVPPDINGGATDVFVREQPVGPPHTSYCFGSVALCPCGNAVEPWSGCGNSDGYGGVLEAIGFASVTTDTVQLVASSLRPNSTIVYLQGDAQANGGLGTALGDGLLCIGGNLRRLGTRVANNRSASFGFATGPGVAVRGDVGAAGGTFHYQGWYRDTISFCLPATFNLTNGISIPWSP